MNLDTAARQPAAGSGGRFYLIGYLPAYAAALSLLLLVWARRPGLARPPRAPDPVHHRVGRSLAPKPGRDSHGGPGRRSARRDLAASPARPGNLAQGSWPRYLGATWARQRQKNRRDRLARAAHLPPGADLTSQAIQQAGAAGYQLRRRFPVPDHLLQPTTLGNVLAAMQTPPDEPTASTR